MQVVLNAGEMNLILDPVAVEGQGGFQGLIESLKRSLDVKTGRIDLTDDHLERIARYAFDYENGGWQDRLVGAFSRTLGPKLGR